MKKQFIAIGLALLLLAGCSYSKGQEGQSGFPKVTKPYQPEQAALNGDVVNVHGNYLNLDKWHQFVDNVKANQEDKVRITQYTIEGDPIFYELTFDGRTIQYTFDNSMDGYGVDQKRPGTSCKGIGINKNEQGREHYVLTECENKTGETFSFEEVER